MGLQTAASGNASTTMGTQVSTNYRRGSFIIGDYQVSNLLKATVFNQMSMHFSGGYRLFTDNNATTGVFLAAGGNSWSSISDSTKKENFLKADGKAFLEKMAGMKLGYWNYKGQETTQYRHYSPMAQEFYALFGNDGIGTIGNDTTIASADIDGVMMIAIQALIKENMELKAQQAVSAATNERLYKIEAKFSKEYSRK